MDKTPNDKLPETTERIKVDAERYTKDEGYQKAYIAGATAVHERAQKMTEILEFIKTYGPVDSLTVKLIDKTLSEWNGAGKEVGDG